MDKSLPLCSFLFDICLCLIQIIDVQIMSRDRFVRSYALIFMHAVVDSLAMSTCTITMTILSSRLPCLSLMSSSFFPCLIARKYNTKH